MSEDKKDCTCDGCQINRILALWRDAVKGKDFSPVLLALAARSIIEASVQCDPKGTIEALDAEVIPGDEEAEFGPRGVH